MFWDIHLLSQENILIKRTTNPCGDGWTNFPDMSFQLSDFVAT